MLWSLPLLATAALLLPIRAAYERAALSESGALLVRGNGDAAGQLLSQLLSSPWREAEARAGLELVAALDGLSSPEVAVGEPALDAFPSALIARAAFERGEFDAALRVTELLETAGVDTVPLLTAAAWIEAGGIEEARYLDVEPARLPGTLARRVAHHLGTPEEQGGVLLRDRTGRPIGTTAGGELRLASHVRPELVPRALSAAIAGHRPSGSLRLTLDLELSEAAFKAFGRYRGSIVIVDSITGEILAAVSDRRTWRKGGTPAFEQMREPASIAKLITTTAAMRAGYEPDQEMRRMRCRGHELYAGKFLYCPTIVGPLRDLERALATSCNVAFANLGVRVGRQAMLDEYRRYGFGSLREPFTSGRIIQPHGDDRQLADLSIGLQDAEITPLHAALMAAVMANDGVMPEPTLLAAEDGRLGLHPLPLPAGQGRRVIDRQWVPEMLAAMETVVQRGTAQRVWPPANFPVAMKTGTASDPRYGFHVNYIGIGPMPDPRLAFCVRITDRPTSVKVRYAARQVTYQLLRNLGRIAERRGWSPDRSREREWVRITEAHSAPGTRQNNASTSRQLALREPLPAAKLLGPAPLHYESVAVRNRLLLVLRR